MPSNPRNEEQTRELVNHLSAKGFSARKIARTLNLHRAKVTKLLRKKEDEPVSEAKPESPAPRPSKLDPFKERVRELSKEPKLSNLKIFQLICQDGYTGGKSILGKFLCEVRGARRRPKAFARYEPLPGCEGQMDWSPWTVPIDGKRTKIHIFSLILSYSRYQYFEAFLDEKQDALFQGHVEAFEYFEGIPAQILYDNQTPVVSARLPSGVALLHPRFERFAAHYGFDPKICLPRNPERKGRVERPFGYLDTSFFPGRSFGTFGDLRKQLERWREGEEGYPTGNFRIHGTTRRRPVDMWQQEERGGTGSALKS